MATRRVQSISEGIRIQEKGADALNEQLARSRIMDAVQAHIRDDLGADRAALEWSLDFGLDFDLAL
jgi:hypothetical protein